MQVLYLTSEYPPRIGGVATHVAELAAAVRAHGISTNVVAPPVAGAAEYDLAHTGQHLLRYSPAVRAQPLYDYLFGRWCQVLLRQQPCSLIHVHGLRPLRAALSCGLPVIFTNHTSGFLNTVAHGGRRLAKLGRLLIRCNFVIAPSEELLSAAREAGFQGPGCYLPNGVDINRFSPGSDVSERTRWGLHADHLVVVIPRRLVAKNGVLVAARALRFCRPEVRFVFVGDGVERAAIEAVLAADQCRERAVLAGAVPNTAMAAVYHASDLCLLPSLMEATSIAGLEAMAAGKALVGTRVGGIPALIDHGTTGLLVPPNDPEALAAAINTLAADRPRLDVMGRAARLRAERTIAIYREVLAAGGMNKHNGSYD
jgi:glycosyltransferase involved in cell wall biosynthesis